MHLIRQIGALILGAVFILIWLVAVPLYLRQKSAAWGWQEWPHTVTTVIGGLLIVAGAVVILYCVVIFKIRGRGTPVPFVPPVDLVGGGLYRYSRNPMYLAYVAEVVGEGLFFGNTALLIYAAVMFVFIHLLVVLHEEPELKRRFGDPYESYMRTIPRWLGRRSAD